MITYQTLDNISLEVLYQTFTDVFSDYEVAFHLSYEAFLATLSKKGYNPYLSIGAFLDHQLVGFVLNGLRMWNQQLTVYDLGTGVIGQMRKQGITSQMLKEIKEMMKQKDVKQYLLEVIKTNEKALKLYQKEGFQIQRELKCYQIEKEKYQPSCKHEVKHVDFLEHKRLQQFWNCQPSWQNSNDSLAAVEALCSHSVVCEQEKIVGYGIIDIVNGDIGQIAVAPSYRNQGIGRSIVSDLIKSTEAPCIKILNVEDSVTQQFLTHIGFDNYVNQYEMLFSL